MTKVSGHRQGIDLARFIASFGVVIAHATISPRDWIGHLSLSLFLILTAFLAAQSALRAGGAYAFAPRAQRLILPWLVWSLFYRLVDEAIADVPFANGLISDPWSLLAGASIHLWFLPFVGMAMVLVGPILRAVTTAERLMMACLILVGFSAPLFFAHETLHLPEPLPQWAFALPCYVLGLLLAIGHQLGKAWVPILTSVALTAVAVWLGKGAPWTVTIVCSVLLFEFFWRLPLRSDWLPPLGQAAFGIYLAHPFFMLVVYKFFGADVNVILGACLAFLMSWVFITVARRFAPFARIT
jgi:surface polysaccharide O-acyltransferase-like enzyme